MRLAPGTPGHARPGTAGPALAEGRDHAGAFPVARAGGGAGGETVVGGTVMRRTLWAHGLLVAAICWGALLSTAVAGEGGGKAGKRKAKHIETKSLEKRRPDTSVNFAKELGLSFPSLTSLGARIEEARQHADPVCLALCARELAVAERVSGKKADVTAEQLFKQAVRMARLRYDPQEIRAVVLIAGKREVAKELVALAKKAREYHEEAVAKRKSGERTRGITGSLIVDSRVPYYLNIYINGNYVGTVSPNGYRSFYVGDSPWQTTYFRAATSDGRLSASNSVSSSTGTHIWTLH
jgi:hypothetical protein